MGNEKLFLATVFEFMYVKRRTEQCVIPDTHIQTGAGIRIGDVGQPSILVPSGTDGSIGILQCIFSLRKRKKLNKGCML